MAMICNIDTEAEKRVISYMIFGRGLALERYASTLKSQHFSDEFLRACFKELVKCYKADRDAFAGDAILVRNLRPKYPNVIIDLHRIGLDNYAAGREILSQIRFYERCLHESFLARGVEWVGSQLIELNRDSTMTPLQIYQKTITEFEKNSAIQNNELPSFENQAIEYFENRKQGKGITLTTGVSFYDDAGCLQRGGNAIIAGLPGRGKSAFAVQLCVEAALRGLTSCYFSFEMPSEAVSKRVLINATRTPERDLETTPEVIEAMTRFEKKIFIFGNEAKLRVDEIEARIRGVQAITKVDIVVVDHIGLAVADNAKATAYEQASQKSRDLKLMAGELDVALVNLCQLNRSVGDEEPSMRHLRDSGRIEEDATSITFIHIDTDEEKKLDPIAKFLVRKNRDGRCGEISQEIIFNKLIQRFEVKRNEFLDEW